MRYELTDHEWATIKPMLPNKPRNDANFGIGHSPPNYGSNGNLNSCWLIPATA